MPDQKYFTEEERRKAKVVAVLKWRREHPEEAKQRRHASYLRHKETRQAKDRARYEAGAERIKEAQRQKYTKDPLGYLQRRYGITEEQFNQLLLQQGGKCLICNRPPNGRWQRLHVDHDHKTNKVRGLLCFKCNAMLGHADDSITTLYNAAAYLEMYAEPATSP